MVQIFFYRDLTTSKGDTVAVISAYGMDYMTEYMYKLCSVSYINNSCIVSVSTSKCHTVQMIIIIVTLLHNNVSIIYENQCTSTVVPLST